MKISAKFSYKLSEVHSQVEWYSIKSLLTLLNHMWSSRSREEFLVKGITSGDEQDKTPVKETLF